MLDVRAAAPTTAVVEHVSGNVRVQLLSPALVRLELRGTHGFEDRPTFTVPRRDFPGGEGRIDGGALVTPRFSVHLPEHRDGLRGITVRRAGEDVFTVGDLPGPSWLPAPADTGPVFALADAPRLVPPPGGAVPQGDGTDPTSGWDLTVDAPDLYLVVTDDARELRAELLRLTGRVPLIPRYALGLWDSRWHAYTDSDALAVIDEYRQRGLPLDAFVLDTDWRVGASEGYAVNTALFPDMPAFMQAAHARGVRVMLNDHPEPQTETALDPEETRFRYQGLASLLEMGADVWWFDRNWWTALHEPLPGLTKETWGNAVFHDITAAVRPGLRPLVMANVDGIDHGRRNRAPHPAQHRYPLWWTGDTTATWEYLRLSVENAVDAGVLGLLPYVHDDAGGHNGTPTGELYGRFIQACALSPVLRIHCTRGLNRFPWAFGALAERMAFAAIRFRYRLLPMLYSAAHRVTADGTPLLRRLDLEFPEHVEARSSTQYLLGDDLLVSPVLRTQMPAPEPVPGTFHITWFDAEGHVLGETGDREEFPPENTARAMWTGEIGPVPAAGDHLFIPHTSRHFALELDGRPWDGAGALRLEAGQHVRLEAEILTGRVGQEAVFTPLWVPEQDPLPMTQTVWVPPGTWVDAYTGTAHTGPTTIEVPVTPDVVPLLVRAGAILFLGDADVRNSDEQLERPLTVEVFLPGPATERILIEDDGISVDPEVTTLVVSHDGRSVGVGPFSREVRLRLHTDATQIRLDGADVTTTVEERNDARRTLDEVFTAGRTATLTLRPSGDDRRVSLS